MNAAYLENRIRRQILCHGFEYTFFRQGEDKYHRPTGEETVAIIKGIYHEGNGYISVSKADSTLVQSKKTPMLLALMADAKPIKQGDYIMVDSKKYKVTGVLDVQNYDVVADISFEVEV